MFGILCDDLPCVIRNGPATRDWSRKVNSMGYRLATWWVGDRSSWIGTLHFERLCGSLAPRTAAFFNGGGVGVAQPRAAPRRLKLSRSVLAASTSQSVGQGRAPTMIEAACNLSCSPNPLRKLGSEDFGLFYRRRRGQEIWRVGE